MDNNKKIPILQDIIYPMKCLNNFSFGEQDMKLEIDPILLIIFEV